MKILGISGSLRSGSSNSALLRATAALAPVGTEFAFYDEQIGELPHFRPDLDGVGQVPSPAVGAWRAAIAAADAVIISSPEYAHGPPGSLKNALDWIVSSGELENKPVALLVASPGGGQRAHAALTPTLRVMGANLVFDRAFVFTGKYVDASGTVTEPNVVEILKQCLQALQAVA